MSIFPILLLPVYILNPKEGKLESKEIKSISLLIMEELLMLISRFRKLERDKISSKTESAGNIRKSSIRVLSVDPEINALKDQESTVH